MGPGGSRGLQILRSGVKSARGGFDSHAFPPLRAGLGALLLAGLLVVPGWAGPSGGAGGDSLVVGPPPAVAAPPAPSPPPAASPKVKTRRPSRFDQPRWVMVRSLVVPGWGQASNHAWFKAAAAAGGEVWLITRLVSDRHRLDRLLAEVADARASGDNAREQDLVDQYNMRLDTYVSHQWILASVVALSVLDAYIDAHFRGFKVEFQGDPALPGGKVPDPEIKIQVRGTF